MALALLGEHGSLKKSRFNTLFFRRFWYLTKVILPSWKKPSVLLFLFLLIVVALEQIIIYNVGLIASKYYQYLGKKDLANFREHTIYSVSMVAIAAMIVATDKYVCNVLYIKWRDLITKHIHLKYFDEVLYYDINVFSTHIDNPDQRITQDVDKLCLQFSQIIAKLVIAPFVIAYYTYKTWSTVGYLGPTLVVAFFFVSTVINKILMSPVTEKVFEQERKEGDFRFKHMYIRSNVEAAAFYRSGQIEFNKTSAKLESLIQTQQKLAVRKYGLSFSVQLAEYVGSILSYMILAIPIFNGWYNYLSPTDLSSLISKNSFVIMYLIHQFTTLIDMASQVAQMAGYTHRICELIEELDVLPPKKPYTAHNLYSDNEDMMLHRQQAFVIENVSFTAPKSDDVLVKGLTMCIRPGNNILVTGSSGCGKTSFLRVLDELWPAKQGKIEWNVSRDPKQVMILPQRPFLTDGSLYDQVLYPLQQVGVAPADEELVPRLLAAAHLGELLQRLGGLHAPCGWNWHSVLSPGEMQRLSFVRLFYHSPKFAFLDEATSQVSEDVERELYRQCDLQRITVISVGHRMSLRSHHHTELRLRGAGGWTLSSMDDAAPSDGGAENDAHTCCSCNKVRTGSSVSDQETSA